jgi:hypothetical protein
MQGKYSPNIPQSLKKASISFFRFNAKGQIRVHEPYNVNYNQETMFGNYSKDGFDRYGYSAYDKDGKYVGSCEGVDRNGITETEYMLMDEIEFAQYLI